MAHHRPRRGHQSQNTPSKTKWLCDLDLSWFVDRLALVLAPLQKRRRLFPSQPKSSGSQLASDTCWPQVARSASNVSGESTSEWKSLKDDVCHIFFKQKHANDSSLVVWRFFQKSQKLPNKTPPPAGTPCCAARAISEDQDDLSKGLLGERNRRRFLNWMHQRPSDPPVRSVWFLKFAKLLGSCKTLQEVPAFWRISGVMRFKPLGSTEIDAFSFFAVGT